MSEEWKENWEAYPKNYKDVPGEKKTQMHLK
jgi:hypothetical protein